MTSTDELRAYAFARSLTRKTQLVEAIQTLGYVQADPIRSPARAQDLILMQRVRGYKVDDLERYYPSLGVEEDIFHNYGFVLRTVQRLIHPRHVETLKIERELPDLSEKVLDFVRERGCVQPREVEAHFGRGSVINAWGGTSNATTRVLDGLQYRGKLRVVRREKGIRVYAIANHLEELHLNGLSRQEQAQGLVQLLLNQYAPLPAQSLGGLVALLGYGAPHLKAELRVALKTIVAERAKIDGFTYVWPEGEIPKGDVPRKVRLLTPFDPVVWDRRRFEHLHGWAYRFEAYTPGPKRKFGYYALPLLWGDKAIGWANIKVADGELKANIGFINGEPKSKTFARELEAELERYRAFLGLVN